MYQTYIHALEDALGKPGARIPGSAAHRRLLDLNHIYMWVINSKVGSRCGFICFEIPFHPSTERAAPLGTNYMCIWGFNGKAGGKCLPLST